ncbi:hypothetical protein [Massilia sp. Root335]|uniref:phage tail assembly chaperone n=1 Tax=Massilia sp. Root335 TaxID=1736517 RepID=UPI0012F68A42|nr:hypothetical protein [Massilia sp. Root335]
MDPPAGPHRHQQDRAFYRRLRESLAECCRAEYELAARQGDGAPLRAHLQRVAQSTGDVDPRLHVAWPRLGRPVWDAFRRMGRSMTVNGPGPVTPQDILAYQALHRVEFSAWELDVIEVFDAIALEAMHKGE